MNLTTGNEAPESPIPQIQVTIGSPQYICGQIHFCERWVMNDNHNSAIFANSTMQRPVSFARVCTDFDNDK